MNFRCRLCGEETPISRLNARGYCRDCVAIGEDKRLERARMAGALDRRKREGKDGGDD